MNNKLDKLILIICLSLALTACGGSDSTKTPDPEPVVNSAPVISSTEINSAEVGTEYSYTLVSTDADNDTLTLSSASLPAWLSFDSATGVLSGTPAASDTGDHAITLTVSDGTDEVTQSFTINVVALPDDGNQPSGDQFLIVSSTQTSDIDLGESLINEWSTGTQIASNITYQSLTSWEMTSGSMSPEAGNWGTVLAFAGGINGDFSTYINEDTNGTKY